MKPIDRPVPVAATLLIAGANLALVQYVAPRELAAGLLGPVAAVYGWGMVGLAVAPGLAGLAVGGTLAALERG